MAEKPVYSSKLLNDEIEKSKGVYYPVKAGFLRCLLIKHAYCSKLHPNLEDEFCDPAIGPNYGIIKRYQLDFKKPKPLPSKSYEGETGDAQEPLIVQKARPDGYMILNGHHRWAAALLLGVRRLKIRIVNLTQESDIHEMLEKSDLFGQSIIGMMALFAYNWKGIGIAAVGLAKALAALKAVARETGVDIKNLYEGQLAHFEKQYNSLSDIDLSSTSSLEHL